MKKILKDKIFIMSFFIVLCYYTVIVFKMESSNAASMWQSVLSSSYYFKWLELALVGISTTFNLYKLISTGFYKNIISKVNYNKLMKKEIIYCIVKTLLFMPIISLLIFLEALIKCKFNLYDKESSFFQIEGSPLVPILLFSICIALYSLLITLCMIIAIYYFKKLYIVIFAGILGALLANEFFKLFVQIYLYCFVNSQEIVFKYIGITLEALYKFIIWKPLWLPAIGSIILNIIMVLVIKKIYKSKEELVLKSE